MKRIANPRLLPNSLCLLWCSLVLTGFATSSRSEETRATFKDGPGMNQPDQYPGAPGEGWTSSWIVRKGRGVEVQASAEGAPAAPRLAVEVTIGEKAQEFNNGAVMRLYDSAGKPHVIRFRIRVDRAEGCNQPSDFVGAFGGRNPGSNFTSDSTWAVRTIGSHSANWRWAAYNGDGHGGPFVGKQMWEIGGWGKGLEVEPGKIYEFTITNHPAEGTYDVTVNNGSRTVKQEGLKYRAEPAHWTPPQAGLAFQAQANEPGDTIAFSVMEIEIAPRP